MDGGLFAEFAAAGGRQSPEAKTTPAVDLTGELDPDHRRGGAGKRSAGVSSAVGMEIGDAMPPCGWGGGPGDLVWRNWESWPGEWIALPWGRRLAGLISGG